MAQWLFMILHVSKYSAFVSSLPLPAANTLPLPTLLLLPSSLLFNLPQLWNSGRLSPETSLLVQHHLFPHAPQAAPKCNTVSAGRNAALLMLFPAWQWTFGHKWICWSTTQCFLWRLHAFPFEGDDKLLCVLPAAPACPLFPHTNLNRAVTPIFIWSKHDWK